MDLKNENVCKYVETIITKDYLFLLSELFYTNLEGEIQNNIKMKNKPSEDETCNLLYDISNGLYYLHKNEIIHGNIRPNNIYKKSDKNVYKLGGYCLINEIDISGIKQYKEIFIDNDVKQNKELKKENDIYSLGKSILYFYENGNINSINKNNYNNKLYLILLRCINEDIKLRPTIVEILEYIKKELNISKTPEIIPNEENSELKPSQQEQKQEGEQQQQPIEPVLIPEFVKVDIEKDFIDLVNEIKIEGKNASNENLQKLLDHLSNNNNNNNINYIRNLCRYLSEKGMITSLCTSFENSDTKGGYLIAGIFSIICSLEYDLIKNDISLVCAICVYCLQQGAIIGLKLLQALLYHYENTVKNGFPNYVRLMIPYINMRNKNEIIIEALRMSYILIDHHSIFCMYLVS